MTITQIATYAFLIMGLAILAHKNYDQDCTLTGGRWFDALPITNMQEGSIDKVARTKGVTAADAYFEGELDEAQIINFLSLTGHNFTQDALIRLRFSNDAGAVTNVLYDTGLIKARNRVYSTSELKSEAANWLTGQAPASELVGEIADFAHPFAKKGYTSVAINASDISFAASDNSINSVSTDLSGFVVGSIILIQSPLNTGWGTVSSKTANKVIITGKTLVDESAAAGFRLSTYDVDYVKAKYYRVDIQDTGNLNVNIAATDISFSTADDSINSVSTDLSGIAVGQTITVTGSAGNSADFTVLTVATHKVTVSSNLVTESAGPSITIKAGYLQMARLFVGEYMEFDHDIQLGSALSFVDLSQSRRAISGKKTNDIRNKLKRQRITYRGLSESKANNIHEMLRQKGTTGEVYFLFDKNNDRFTFKKSFLGTVEDLGEIIQDRFGYYTWSGTLEQKL